MKLKFFQKRSRLPLLIATCVLLVTAPALIIYSLYSKSANAAWYDSSWSYRKELVFNNSASGTNLTDFAVMVKLTSSNFNFSQAQSAGQDIRFTDTDGTTLLSYEIEKFDTGGGEAIIWVKVPQIDATSTTDAIYLYWGNGSAVDAQSADNTWNTNYKGVYHLNDNAASTTVTDSSGNANTITSAENTSNGFYKSTGNTAGSFLTAGTPTYITNQTASNISELYPDIALDSSGFPVIAYYDGTNLDLIVVHCNDKECKGGDESIQTVVSANDQGAYPSIQLDSSGYPMIAYHDVTGLDLEYVHCNDVNCAGANETYTTLDSTSSVGQFPRMIKDASGFPVIAYHYLTALDLRVIHCGNVDCSSGNVTSTVDSAVNLGAGVGNIDIVLDGSGYPVISYYDTTNTEPKVAHCNDVNCAGSNESLTSPVSVLGISHGASTAIELDGTGLPMVAYYNGTNLEMNFIHCDDVNCAGDESAGIKIIESNYGQFPTMEKNSSGYPVILATLAVQTPIAHVCADTNCSSVTSTPLIGASQANTTSIRFKLDASNNIFGVGYGWGKTGLWDVIYFATQSKLSRTYDADFDFGTGSFSISTWFKSNGMVQNNTLLSRYDTDQGFSLNLNHSGHPCFQIDDDATWDPDDSVCASDSQISTNVENRTGWIYGQDMELDSSGYPVVAYHEGSLLDLILVKCNDVNCTGGNETTTTLDSTGNVGVERSLILDSSGYPVIAYYDTTNANLKIIHCGNATCSSGNTTNTIDSTGDVGRAPTIKLDGSGYPVIAYNDTTNTAIKLIHCDDVNCSGGDVPVTVVNTEDDRSDAGTSSLVLDSSGFPMIVFMDKTNSDLEYVHCNDVNCAGANETYATLATLGNVGNYSSIVLDGSGFPVVATITAPTGNGQISLIHCGNADCSSGNTTNTINTLNGGSENFELNLEINSSGYPVLLYGQQASRANMLTVCNDVNCAGDNETHSLIRGSDFNYHYHSLELDSNNYPVIGLSQKVRDLQVIHLNNITTFTESSNYDDDAWHHMVAVKNGTSSITLYLDGVAVATDSTLAASGTLTSNSAALYLAQDISSSISSDNWTGYMDEIQIDTTARSADWVKAQYLSESNNFINVKFTQYGAIANALGNFTNNTGAIKNNLVAHYKFDEGYGTTANNSGSLGASANGTISGSTWTNGGKLKKALIFDGINDYVQLGTSNLDTYFEALDDWSVSTSFKISSWSSEGTVFANRYGDTEFIRIQTTGSTGELIVTTRDSTSTVIQSTLTGLSLETWYRLAVSRDYGGNFVIYLDGKPVYSTSDTRTGDFISEAGSHEYFAGRAIYSGDWVSWRYFTGIIDEVKIYSAALTAAEVLQDYNQKSTISLGSLSDTSALTGGSVASTSASALYCVPGSTDSCNPPIAEWKMEEGTGTTANDSSGNGKIGTLTNSPTWGNGKIGKAINFDGVDDLISTNLNTSLSSYTISAWIYPRTLGEGSLGRVFDKREAGVEVQNLYVESTYFSVNQLFSVNKGQWRTPNNSMTLNAWNYISITFDTSSSSNDPTIYVNGISQTLTETSVPSGTVSTTTDNYIIGNRGDATRTFDGLIDDFRIYNYIRTPAQIAWDYNQGKPVSHYKLDDCAGSNLNDSSGNGQTIPITIGATGSQTAIGTCATSGAWFNGTTGKYNSSLNFDGTDDYARKTSYPYDMRSRFTLSTWIKSSSMCSGSHYLVELEYGKPLLWTGGAGCTANVTMRDPTDTTWNSYVGTTALTNNTWYHLATTYDTTTDSVKIYVNGKQDGTGSHTTQGGTAATVLGLGGRSTVYFPGQMDDTRVFNYALTPAQIKMLYNESAAVRFGP